MRHSTAFILALASLGDASPLPQFSMPTAGGSPPGDSGPLVPTPPAGAGGDLLMNFQATQTEVPQAPSTRSTEGGTVVGNCAAQGNGGGSTENGVADKNCCTDLTVIFARGTGEFGNVGTISGPLMFQSLREKLGAERVTVQGVGYPASAAGNVNLGADGGPAMAESVKAALSQCPSTKVVVSGYSQGGMVVHNAFSAQGLSSSQVAGAVLFGDPFISQGVGDLPEAKVKQFCGTTDTVCSRPMGDVNGGHLSYGSVAGAAADFVISAAGLS